MALLDIFGNPDVPWEQRVFGDAYGRADTKYIQRFIPEYDPYKAFDMGGFAQKNPYGYSPELLAALRTITTGTAPNQVQANVLNAYTPGAFRQYQPTPSAQAMYNARGLTPEQQRAEMAAKSQASLGQIFGSATPQQQAQQLANPNLSDAARAMLTGSTLAPRTTPMAPAPAPAPVPAPLPAPVPPRPSPAPATAGGGLFTPRSGGLFGGTQTMGTGMPNLMAPTATPYGAAPQAPVQAAQAPKTTAGSPYQGGRIEARYSPDQPATATSAPTTTTAAFPGRTAPITAGRGVAAPTGAATVGSVPGPSSGYLGGAIAPGVQSGVPGLQVAQGGLLGNLTGRLEATQGASRFNNAQNWLQDMLNNPSLAGRSAEEALGLGNRLFGGSPETFALNDVLTKGIPGQFSIQDIAGLLMSGAGEDPLSVQSRGVLSELISGRLRPPNQAALEGGTADQFGRAPQYQNAFQALMELNPGILEAAFGQIQGQGSGENPLARNFINQTIAGGIPGLDPVAQFAGNQMQQGNPDLARILGFAGTQMDQGNPNLDRILGFAANQMQTGAPGLSRVSNFAGDILDKGLTGGYEEAFRRRYYEPARERLLGDLAQRGVLDSGERMRQEADLLQQNYLDALLLEDLGARERAAGLYGQTQLQDLAARERGAGLFGETAQAQQATRERGAGLYGDTAQAQQAARERGAGLYGSTIQAQQAARERAAGLGQGERGLNLEAARTTGGLGGLNLDAARALLGAGQGAFGAGVGGYQAGNELLMNILGMGTGAGGAAEERALGRVQTGFGGIGQVNRDLLGYLGLAQQGTQARAGLGLEAASGEANRALQAQLARQGLLGDVASRELQSESMNINALIDLINAQLAAQTGTEQAEATRRASRNQAVGSGIGAAAALLPLLLSARVLKQDIEPFEDKEAALDRVQRIPLRTYRFRDFVYEDDKEHLGWINDEVDQELVGKSGMDIDLHSVLGHLVASIQALSERLERLEKR